MQLTLYSAWRSSAAYRVRIGLNLKGLAYDIAPVNLVANQHQEPAFAALNPQRLLPALEADGRTLTQSLAILEWLDETVPEPPLLPAGAFDRAAVRTMSLIVASDIHPVNNLRILRALTDLGVDEPDREAWIRRWITDGFTALETMIVDHGKGFAFGGAPSLADCCLIPQVYNAERFKTDLTPFPAIRAVAARCAEHPAFVAAHPNNQPDAIHA
ncbi:maleylacetoacetate isomerase [Caulobacter sp.]|uniref:maleylacetoacetate isomerase n=1 Tax=Caulobacter sp. TaxID=78 RepID=UPI003BB0693C